MALTDDCAAREAAIRAYAEQHRAEVMGEKKSRETPLAVFGFRLSTWVEPLSRKIKWSEIVERCQWSTWAEAYLNYKPPTVNKEALHADKATLTEAKLTQIGVKFCTEDAFYFEAKPESAQGELSAGSHQPSAGGRAGS